MNEESSRQVAERIAKAKDELLSALRVAESNGGSKSLINSLNALCGKAEILQNKPIK